MKTTLSKSLLCGLIASSFILVNCQKDPSGRSVKAEVGNPGPANPADKVTAVDKEQNLVLCTPEFNKAYKDYFDLLTTSRIDVYKTVEFSETRKADLLRIRKDLEDKVKPAMDEFGKLKSDVKTATGELKKVDGCYFDATKKKIVTIKMVNDDLNKIDLKIAEITGEKSARSEAAIADQKAADAEAKRVAKGITYKVSAELNELLDEPISTTSKHFVDGRIADKAELEANKSNIKTAVCEVTVTSGKLAEDQLVLKSLGEESAKQENKKNIYSVNLGQLANQGDKTYKISCSLPTDMKKQAGFQKAMGSFLTAQSATDVTASENANELARIEARSKSATAMAADDAKKVETEAQAASQIEADAKAAADEKAKAAAAPAAVVNENEESGT